MSLTTNFSRMLKTRAGHIFQDKQCFYKFLSVKYNLRRCQEENAVYECVYISARASVAHCLRSAVCNYENHKTGSFG